MAQNDWKTLGVTSARAREGKTLTALNLGISIARDFSKSVLIVDADLKRPSVHRCLGIEPELGLADHLVKGEAVEKMLINPGIDRVVVLPAGSAPDMSSELLASISMVRLIQGMRDRYASRIVIFDLPPVLAGDDVVAIAPHLDCFLLVVAEGITTIDDAEHVGQVLSSAKVLGTVLNKAVGAERTDYSYHAR